MVCGKDSSLLLCILVWSLPGNETRMDQIYQIAQEEEDERQSHASGIRPSQHRPG